MTDKVRRPNKPAPIELTFVERLGRLGMNSGAAFEVDVFRNARGFNQVRVGFRRPNGIDVKFIDLPDFAVPEVHRALGQFLTEYEEQA